MERKRIRSALTFLALFSMAVAFGCRSGREQSLRTIYKGAPEPPDEAETSHAADPALEGLYSARIFGAPTSEDSELVAPKEAVPIMRVVLTPTEIRIDDSELVSFLTERRLVAEDAEEERVPAETLPEAQSHVFPWPEEASGYRFAALQDASARMRERATIYLGSDSLPPSIELSEEDEELLDRRVWLFVDRSLPYEKVAKVVYSLAMAGIDAISFRVEGRDGDLLLEVALPALCDHGSAPPSPCTHLVFVSVEEGLHANANTALESADGCLAMGGDASTRRSPGWDGRQILGDQAACPALPRAEEEVTPDQVEGLLEDVAELGALCSSVTLIATPDHAWQPLAEALAALLANDRRVVLGADTEFSGMVLDEAWRRCEGGFIPSEASTDQPVIESAPDTD